MRDLQEMAEPTLQSEFFRFLRHGKRWLLLPLIVIVAAVVLLVVLVGPPSTAAFQYPAH